jgi:hypothetical protein
MKKLIEKYETICNEIVAVFCEKQDMDFDYWAAGDVGSIGFFGDYCFSVDEILLDLSTEQEKYFILEYHDANVEFNMGKDDPKFINYKSYISGLRHEQLK